MDGNLNGGNVPGCCWARQKSGLSHHRCGVPEKPLGAFDDVKGRQAGLRSF